MNFKNFYLLQEKIENNFCYMIYPEQPYVDYIQEIQNIIFSDSEYTANELVPANDFHCTIRHAKLSYGQTPDKFLEYMSENPLPNLTAYTEKFSVFDGQTLVMELDSPEIREWFSKINSWLKTVGGYAESDYKLYRPHVSLAYGFNKTDPPKFDQRRHRIKIKFPNHKITNQNYDEIFQKMSDYYNPSLSFGMFSDNIV